MEDKDIVIEDNDVKIVISKKNKPSGGSSGFRLVLPWFLAILSLLFIGFGIFHLVRGVNAKKDVEHNLIVEDIINNPGSAWEEWAQIWEYPDTTWNDLEEPFAAVHQDWENRGVNVTWDAMTVVFKNIYGAKTFDRFQNALFNQIRDDLYVSFAEDTMKEGIGWGVTLLVLGSVLLIFIVIKAIFAGSFVGMFY